MTSMYSTASRRTLAFKIAALLASAGLVASTGGLAQAAGASAEPTKEIRIAQSEAAPATPPASAVEAPPSLGSVDVSKLMAEGPPCSYTRYTIGGVGCHNKHRHHHRQEAIS